MDCGEMGLLYCSFFLVLFNTNVLCEMNITEELRQDFFDICKGVAIFSRNVTMSPVLREHITYRMFRNNIEPKEIVLTPENAYVFKNTQDKIVFITHGWTDSANSEWIEKLKNALLNTYPEWTVITVDWSEPAFHFYYVSAINVEDVGNFIGSMISNIIDNHGIDINQIIFIGHSLGAHVAAFVGKRLKQFGKLLPRIIALDPAGPLFETRPESSRLNSNDAEYVMVLHTDTYAFGFKNPIGHIDFYANSGSFQPGCFKLSLFDFPGPIACDHQRAYEYFTESIITPLSFEAVNCPVWNLVSSVCNYNVTMFLGDFKTKQFGNFYFKTNRESPYSQELVSNSSFFSSVKYFLSKIG